ncbi:MAG: nucleotidyltransferase family protein [Leptolyngbyaceae cyanobacterium RU_5_1]|nr:nucleotidyltransferase family protein [Leptolyngbyaceae cyanobacterium RU_5_1]
MNQQLCDRLQVSPEQIETVCQQWQITELALFGSVLRDDFHPDSDVDVLVTFAPDAKVSLLDLVELQHQLANLLGREVDVIEKQTIETSPNWIRRQEILNTATVIYGPRQRLSA